MNFRSFEVLLGKLQTKKIDFCLPLENIFRQGGVRRYCPHVMTSSKQWDIILKVGTFAHKKVSEKHKSWEDIPRISTWGDLQVKGLLMRTVIARYVCWTTPKLLVNSRYSSFVIPIVTCSYDVAGVDMVQSHW